MKVLFALLLCGVAAPAQTPAPAKAPAKGTATKSVAPAAPAAATPAPPRTNPALLNPAALHAPAPALFRVKFATTHGDFVVEVTRDWAPLGADRFYNLVKNRFFT